MHEKQSIWKKLISRTLGNKKTQSVTIPVFCVLIGLIAGAVVIAVLGKNPFSAYYNLLQGCGLAPKASYAGYKSILTDFLSFLLPDAHDFCGACGGGGHADRPV